MQEVMQAGCFEQTLLDHVSMCYGVALSLTRNPSDARALTLDVVMKAWQLHNHPGAPAVQKTQLLSAIRDRFLQRRRFTAYAFSPRQALSAID